MFDPPADDRPADEVNRADSERDLDHPPEPPTAPTPAADPSLPATPIESWRAPEVPVAPAAPTAWSPPEPWRPADPGPAATSARAAEPDAAWAPPTAVPEPPSTWAAGSAAEPAATWASPAAGSEPPSTWVPPAPTAPGPPRGRGRPVLAALVVVSLAASGFAVVRSSRNHTTTIVRTTTASSNSTDSTAQTTPAVVATGDTSEPVAAVATALAPSVVQIETSQGLGSGVIYDSAGHILTAAHVVAGAAGTVTVRLADGATRTGTVVGSDTTADVAVVKIDLSGTKAKVARLATGTPLQVGQLAVAIGSPFGLDQTVTSGIVSAVDRAVQTSNGAAIDMVQTDAPINPGNSGGPLADREGRVIGINDQIETESGTSSGVGFAIPIDTAKAVADKLVAGQPVTFAFLGVQTQDAGQGVVGDGALIVSVESGSPAEQAGIHEGDIVTQIDGTTVDSSTTLSGRIRSMQPGAKVTLTVTRNGTTHTITVTLGSTPAA